MHALMRIGDGVQKLVVAGGLNLSSAMLHSMLILCPNVQHLDVSYTYINDLAFKGYFHRSFYFELVISGQFLRLATKKACSVLQHLDLTGCPYVTDVGLERLGACFASAISPDFSRLKCGSCKPFKQCPKQRQSAGTVEPSVQRVGHHSPGLSYLSLSGCSSVTDFGLRSLLESALFAGSLLHLDLSGCPMVSGPMLSAIVDRSPRLLPQDLYYCNRIEEGPYPDEANGCQNLECPVRSCCCFDA